ncbi:C6 transcription factor [Stagonosporopsis vannaccii]|nr:C6 transcription factor [Stagonosporopsis vannaccii]
MAQERPLLRPLLPTTTRRAAAPLQRRPRDRVASACEACRQRKTKCNGAEPGDDGIRPVCWECQRRSTPCRYAAQLSETQGQAIKRKHDVLQRQNEAYTELFALIQTRPDNESLEIMRRIKMGADVEDVLRHVRDGDLLVQLSVEPETRLRYTLPYMDAMPAFLLVDDNQYLNTPLYEATFKAPNPQKEALDPDTSNTTKCMDPYMKPSHAAEVVEPILDRVHARQWTNIISDDGLFRRLITIYISHQHATFFWFNKELFLGDLVARRTQFCSSLLVNAVLAAACQAYKGIPDLAKFWMPNNLQNRLLLEAKRLWELEMGISRLTSIHAAQVLHGVLNGNGLSTIGDFYTSQAIIMAQNLRIFEPAAPTLSRRLQRGQEFTAWALWLWQVGVTYYYRRAPFVQNPPEFAAPDPDHDPEWYGEVYVRYPLSPTVTRMRLGYVIKATIDLRIIMNDIALAQFASQGPTELSSRQVLEFKRRLESFNQKLPAALAPSKILLPCHFNVHTEYHMAMHSLFQSQTVTRQATIASPPELFDGKTALQIQNEAYIRFETILRIRYLRHSFNAYDAWGLLFLIYLGNLALDSLSNASDGPDASSKVTTTDVTRSTAVLCINGLIAQSQSVYAGTLLSFSMIERLKPADKALLSRHISTVVAQVDYPFDSKACYYSISLPAFSN